MAQEQHNIDCIYDFIYLDTKRLTSFLAQLDDDGVLMSIKRTRHIEEEQKNLGSVGVNVATRATTEDNATIGKQSERHYDSSAVALYSVIDRLDELGFIKKSISATAMGQLLLCSGTITFQDIRMMRDLWDPITAFSYSISYVKFITTTSFWQGLPESRCQDGNTWTSSMCSGYRQSLPV